MPVRGVNVIITALTKGQGSTSRSGQMTDILEFPDGVRLARLDEIPGPETDRAEAWSRMARARISPGFTLADAPDLRFRYYAEINVNASRIWAVFCDLCAELLSDPATLIAGDDDAEPREIAEGDVSKLLNILEPHQYQLAHDGFLQFGLLNDQVEEIAEVFVTPTKHFKVWLNDIGRFHAIMKRHELGEQTKMEFIDEYPRVTTRLPEARGIVVDPETLWKDVGNLVSGVTRMQ